MEEPSTASGSTEGTSLVNGIAQHVTEEGQPNGEGSDAQPQSSSDSTKPLRVLRHLEGVCVAPGTTATFSAAVSGPSDEVRHRLLSYPCLVGL